MSMARCDFLDEGEEGHLRTLLYRFPCDYGPVGWPRWHSGRGGFAAEKRTSNGHAMEGGRPWSVDPCPRVSVGICPARAANRFPWEVSGTWDGPRAGGQPILG